MRYYLCQVPSSVDDRAAAHVPGAQVPAAGRQRRGAAHSGHHAR